MKGNNMNKPNQFFLAAAIIVVMLFILGDWAKSVQAVGAENINAMPTPTIMPTKTLPEEIPSAEEQEALKAIIQAYIEIRYCALSVSNAEAFNQDEFDNLVSELPEASSFLREEKAKLAVQVKHAELDHLRYVNYRFFLNFRSITVDPATQIATVAVVEGNEVVYEISQELNPTSPIVSRTGGIEHTILLRKEQDGWKIISDSYYDDLWKMLRASGDSTDEILRKSDNLLDTMEPTLKTTNAAAATLLRPSLPDDPSSHPYDRAGAVAYALKYWGGRVW